MLQGARGQGGPRAGQGRAKGMPRAGQWRANGGPRAGQGHSKFLLPLCSLCSFTLTVDFYSQMFKNHLLPPVIISIQETLPHSIPSRLLGWSCEQCDNTKLDSALYYINITILPYHWYLHCIAVSLIVAAGWNRGLPTVNPSNLPSTVPLIIDTLILFYPNPTPICHCGLLFVQVYWWCRRTVSRQL